MSLPFFSLIICTYKRAEPLKKLLDSVRQQSLSPNEILIIDGSPNDRTKQMLAINGYDNLKYRKVSKSETGLTKQRNVGIGLVDNRSELICFLDDDIILTKNYFKELISTYTEFPNALAVGGYINNEVEWTRSTETKKTTRKFLFDGWSREEPLRFRVRKWFGLLPDANPGYLPTFSHGRSIGFLPPSGKVYQVEQIMGGVSSYKREIFTRINFSEYFEGYGLYEDADFSLRISKMGKLYVNTNAQLSHYHHDSGRPNKYKYGKMVVRNGWYIWRTKYPHPQLKARIKWNLTSLLLTIIRFLNVINTKKKKEAFTEGIGRISGWFSLLINKPKIYN